MILIKIILKKLNNFLKKLKGEPYSINKLKKF